MQKLVLAAIAALVIASSAHAQTRIDSINTNFRWLGPDDKIIVERYDDPRVQNVSCYMSRAETGGIKGGIGIAEDPAASPSPAARSGRLPCRQACRSPRSSASPPPRCSSRASRSTARSIRKSTCWSIPLSARG